MKKRSDYIKWDEAHMSMAFIAARRSKEPVCQNGAMTVDPKTQHPKSFGYTGMPNGCGDDEFPWGDDNPDPLHNKHSYCVHAELNCLLNAEVYIAGCTMYFYSGKGFPPCNECAKAIIQKGIKKVVCCVITRKKKSTNFNWEPTRRMFQSAGVELAEMEDISFLKRLSDDFMDAYKKMLKIQQDNADQEDVGLFDDVQSDVKPETGHGIPENLDQTNSIGPFVGVFRYLSNFYLTKISWRGMEWGSTEHAFQAAKFDFERDAKIVESIRNATGAAETKTIAHNNKDRWVSNWHQIKNDIMLELLRIKFSNEYLAGLLKNTADKYLIERNWWKDFYWGTDMNDRGENWLGRLLMKVREEIRKGEST